jgi:DNA-binding beta-propeller fold protein YncE
MKRIFPTGRFWLSCLVSLAAAGLCRAQSPDLYVVGFFSSSVQRFSGPTTAFPGQPRPAPGLSGAFFSLPVSRRPWAITAGPDGNLYVADLYGFGSGTGTVMRVGASGTSAVIISDAGASSLVFSPQGPLLVGFNGEIRGYDPHTGVRLGIFASGAPLAQVHGMAIGPDRQLWVVSSGAFDANGSRLIRYDVLTGALLGYMELVDPNGGSFGLPYALAFDPIGSIYVATGDGFVLRFHGPLSSQPGSPFPAPGFPGPVFTYMGTAVFGLAAGPDGKMYATAGTSNAGAVVRFDHDSGAVEIFVGSVDGGPRGLAFFP